jgi:hypothetical protein
MKFFLACCSQFHYELVGSEYQRHDRLDDHFTHVDITEYSRCSIVQEMCVDEHAVRIEMSKDERMNDEKRRDQEKNSQSKKVERILSFDLLVLAVVHSMTKTPLDFERGQLLYRRSARERSKTIRR